MLFVNNTNNPHFITFTFCFIYYSAAMLWPFIPTPLSTVQDNITCSSHLDLDSCSLGPSKTTTS